MGERVQGTCELTGWQWRRWYQDHLAGKLAESYRLLLLDKDQVKPYVERGVVEINEEISATVSGQN